MAATAAAASLPQCPSCEARFDPSALGPCIGCKRVVCTVCYDRATKQRCAKCYRRKQDLLSSFGRGGGDGGSTRVKRKRDESSGDGGPAKAKKAKPAPRTPTPEEAATRHAMSGIKNSVGPVRWTDDLADIVSGYAHGQRGFETCNNCGMPEPLRRGRDGYVLQRWICIDCGGTAYCFACSPSEFDGTEQLKCVNCSGSRSTRVGFHRTESDRDILGIATEIQRDGSKCQGGCRGVLYKEAGMIGCLRANPDARYMGPRTGAELGRCKRRLLCSDCRATDAEGGTFCVPCFREECFYTDIAATDEDKKKRKEAIARQQRALL